MYPKNDQKYLKNIKNSKILTLFIIAYSKNLFDPIYNVDHFCIHQNDQKKPEKIQ